MISLFDVVLACIFVDQRHSVNYGSFQFLTVDLSFQVFEQFLFGFPPQWEVFNKKYLGRESKGKAAASDALGFEKPSACSESMFTL